MIPNKLVNSIYGPMIINANNCIAVAMESDVDLNLPNVLI
jgi:hypothetical protein